MRTLSIQGYQMRSECLGNAQRETAEKSKGKETVQKMERDNGDEK